MKNISIRSPTSHIFLNNLVCININSCRIFVIHVQKSLIYASSIQLIAPGLSWEIVARRGSSAGSIEQDRPHRR